jgi:type IV secretory pathway ATPase VirB11/archaellum biosynthesis ATPase
LTAAKKRAAGRRKPKATECPRNPRVRQALAGALEADSTLESEVARETLAFTAAALKSEIARLQALADSGAISADESKSLSAASSNLRRTLEALGVLEAKKKKKNARSAMLFEVPKS